MPLIDPAAQNASLDMSYGASRGSSAPDNLLFELWTGDPREDGSAELDSDGGYAAVAAANDASTWPDAAADGEKVSDWIDFGTSTGAFSDEATWLLIRDADTSDAWDAVPLAVSLSVEAAGVPVSTRARVFYNSLEA